MTAYTATLTVATPRGIRYRGVSYLGNARAESECQHSALG